MTLIDLYGEREGGEREGGEREVEREGRERCE